MLEIIRAELVGLYRRVLSCAYVVAAYSWGVVFHFPGLSFAVEGGLDFSLGG